MNKREIKIDQSKINDLLYLKQLLKNEKEFIKNILLKKNK